MTALWTRDDVIEATGGFPQGADWQASGVSIDSRSIEPGDLFIALAGPNHDGHDHVAAALAAGAAGAIVHRLPAGLGSDAPLVICNDTMDALAGLGRFARDRAQARIVAVTGSVGKTGTKEMLKRALEDQGKTHASVGSFNNHWGVPLSLARMEPDCRFAIFEIGMNHPGEITPLVRLVRPHAAIITTVEAVHMEFFRDTAEICAAKCEIFEGLDPAGTAIINRDNRHFEQMLAAAQAKGIATIHSFGQASAADARPLDVSLEADKSTVFAQVAGKRFTYGLGVPGLHWVMNSLAVLLAAKALGADLEQAGAALALMSPPKGRGQRHDLACAGGRVQLIDESYNASPVAVKAAIATLAGAKPGPGGRRIAVLGDMLELGEQSSALHLSLAEPLQAHKIDLVFCAGPFMGQLFDALPATQQGAKAADSAALVPLVAAAIHPGDVVMVKGSAGSRMGRIVANLLETDSALNRAAQGSTE